MAPLRNLTAQWPCPFNNSRKKTQNKQTTTTNKFSNREVFVT